MTETATQSIIDSSLVPNPAHEPHEVRLQQLMRIQRNRQMTIYGPNDFCKKSVELLKDAVINKGGFLQFSVQNLQYHLVNKIPFQATGYDQGVCLDQLKPMAYRHPNASYYDDFN